MHEYQTISNRSHRDRVLITLRAACLTAAVLLAWSATSATLLTTCRGAWGDLVAPAGARPEDAVTVIAAGAGLAVTSWWATGVLLTALAAATPATWAAAGWVRSCAVMVAPAVVRRALYAGLGVTLLGVALPAASSPASASACLAGGGTTAAAEAVPAPAVPAWLPEAPTAHLSDRGHAVEAMPNETAPKETTWSGTTVVVRPGDTLWSLAAGRLGRQASPAQVAREWPRWYALNRVVIGSDPDRIRPGQRVRVPRETA
jgi:nucleoid-associated protein YgaU